MSAAEQPAVRSGLAEERLSRLEDLRAIEDLQYRYAWALDHDDGVDPGAIATCFTEDGVWWSDGIGAEIHGRREIQRFFEGLKKYPSELHYTTNLRIQLDDDGLTATARAYLACFCSGKPEAEPNTEPLVIATTYRSRCRKVDGHWLFVELRAQRRWASAATVDWPDADWEGGDTNCG